jgi:hypothetical protein
MNIFQNRMGNEAEVCMVLNFIVQLSGVNLILVVIGGSTGKNHRFSSQKDIDIFSPRNTFP